VPAWIAVASVSRSPWLCYCEDRNSDFDKRSPRVTNTSCIRIS